MATKKKAAPKKAAPKKIAPNKAAPKKAAPKKVAPKKAAPKKAAPSKTASYKSAPKKTSKKPQDDKSLLHEFFVDELKDIYWAEKHLVKNLPKLHKAAGSDELKTALANHLEETKVHVSRLEEVFELLGQKAQAKKCDAMDGLVTEAGSIVEDTEKGTATRDVGIILASQKVEHYEIATYGGLAQLAKTLGLEEIKGILGTTLEEEKAADETLTEVAESSINVQAAEEEDDEEDDDEEEDDDAAEDEDEEESDDTEETDEEDVEEK